MYLAAKASLSESDARAWLIFVLVCSALRTLPLVRELIKTGIAAAFLQMIGFFVDVVTNRAYMTTGFHGCLLFEVFSSIV
jgi:hypothetical protein